MLQKVIRMGILKMPANRRLFACVGRVLTIVPFSVAMHYLNILLGPYFEEFHNELKDVDPLSHRISIITKLKILGSLFLSMTSLEENEKADEPKPLLQIIQITFSVYESIAEKFCNDLTMMEVKIYHNIYTNIIHSKWDLVNKLANAMGI